MKFKEEVKGVIEETGELLNELEEVIGEIDSNGRVIYY